jgi:hypothetical protein
MPRDFHCSALVLRTLALVCAGTLSALAAACGGTSSPSTSSAGVGGPEAPVPLLDGAALSGRGWSRAVALPEPLSNNAVASVEGSDGCTVVTALGLTAPRASAITSHAYAWTVGTPAWRRLPDVPGKPRIAASAVSLRGRVFVLGGYDVAPDGTETSHAEMVALDLKRSLWTTETALPVAIDDAVAVTFADRFIVVVSGWSTTAPVATTQVYDADTGTWTVGTPFPGTPVFGHAAAAFGNSMIVIDGVAQTAAGYAIKAQAWRGVFDPMQPANIVWSDLGKHVGPPLYRAAGVSAADGSLLFSGGSADPYNFDGLSYKSQSPSRPEAQTLSFDLRKLSFSTLAPTKPEPTMDHRALARCGAAVYAVGGMVQGGAVRPSVWRLQ